MKLSPPLSRGEGGIDTPLSKVGLIHELTLLLPPEKSRGN
ncbi:hypothetical protein amyaer_0346 [Microcystis aeruginosa NIES-2481]|nr:hypothetical protein amyaer_0346 [Microcystis aeruginosa NIES-2481]